MVSSTFTDLEEHRAELIKIIERRGLKAIPMENDAAYLPVMSSIPRLGKVRDGSAYVGIIAKRYGQIPLCAKRNPRKVSITELEFDEAVRLKRPILLFIMGKDHLVRESQIETKAANKKKLKGFRERAKEMGPDTKVHRVYATSIASNSSRRWQRNLLTHCAATSTRRIELPQNPRTDPPRTNHREVRTRPHPTAARLLRRAGLHRLARVRRAAGSVGDLERMGAAGGFASGAAL